MSLNNIMVDILIIPLLLLLFCGAEFTKPLKALNSGDYLSIDTGKCFRGFFAVAVVFHHLSQRIGTGIAFPLFRSVGYLAVAFFFFISGYGLQKSYISKSDGYRKGFLLKRIPTVLIPYIIITAVYWLMNFVGGKFYSLKDIIIAIINGSPITSNSWYIINILVFYVVYWLLMLICRKHYFIMMLGGTAWYALYVVFCVKMGYGGWWYNASHLLILGMFWATYEDKILEFLNKRYLAVAPVVTALFLTLFLAKDLICSKVDIRYTHLIIELFVSLLFVLFVILFSLKVKIGNKALSFLGEISLEIYISQGLFFETLRSKFIFIKNDLLWCIAVLAGTIVFSYCIHIVFQFILKKYRSLLQHFKI